MLLKIDKAGQVEQQVQILAPCRRVVFIQGDLEGRVSLSVVHPGSGKSAILNGYTWQMTGAYTVDIPIGCTIRLSVNLVGGYKGSGVTVELM